MHNPHTGSSLSPPAPTSSPNTTHVLYVCNANDLVLNCARDAYFIPKYASWDAYFDRREKYASRLAYFGMKYAALAQFFF